MTHCKPNAPKQTSLIHRGLPSLFRAALLALLAFAVLAPAASAQRTDNRRLFWTGSDGAVWNNSAASWMTTGSFLAYVDTGSNSAVWSTTIPGTGEPVTAVPNATFIQGDVAIFDGRSDAGGSLAVVGSTRVIAIADEGVRVSDVVVNTSATTTLDGSIYTPNYVFTGGAIIADPSYVAPGSVQVTGTGVGYATDYVRPTGSLVKLGVGTLTLSNTAANVFPGGIHLLGGVLSIADNRALGDNNIITMYLVSTGTYATASHIYGDTLFSQIHIAGIGAAVYNKIPASVVSVNGQLVPMSGPVSSLHVAPSAAGLDITGDIYIGNRAFTFDIEGDTTISGRILAQFSQYGSVNGSIIKTGTGTLFLTGTQNWFYSGNAMSHVNEGRLVTTNHLALGTGPFNVEGGAVLEFRAATGVFRQSFRGDGTIEITQGSDITFNWRDGVLYDFELLTNPTPSQNTIKSIVLSGASRLSAIASGTYSGVLGGSGAYVVVTEGSTLAVGREGISGRGYDKIPMTFSILANRIDLAGGSTLILNPNAYLNTGALIVTDNSTCTIGFGGSGVSRLRWQEGIDPDSIIIDPNAPDIPNGARYVVPAGMELYIEAIPVPLPTSQSIPVDTSPSGWCREYVVLNQGANPLNDIAMTMGAINAAHDTFSMRLADDFIDPVGRLTPSRGRKWVNSAWLRYMHSNFDCDAGNIITPGFKGTIDGAVIGANGILPGRTLLGFYGGIAENRLDTTNDVTVASKQKFVGLNAAQRFGKLYVALDIAAGSVRTDSKRTEAIGIIRSNWDTSYYSGALQVGATFSVWEQIMLRPYAGVRYSKLKLSNYFERGASQLIIDNFNDNCSQVVYGLAASRKFVVFKRNLAAELSLGRKQTVGAPRATLDTAFYEAPMTRVQLKRGDYYAGLTTVGLTLRAALSKNTLAGISGEYETSSSRTNASFSAMVGYTW